MSIRDLSRGVLEHIPEAGKHVLDALSIATLLGSLVSMLPSIATLLTVIWSGLRVYQMVLELGDRKRRLAREAAEDATRAGGRGDV